MQAKNPHFATLQQLKAVVSALAEKSRASAAAA
jgi:hypothetical protein